MQFLEDNEDYGDDFNRYAILILIPVFVLGVGYFAVNNTEYSMNKNRLERNIKAEYSGRIVEKGIDSLNHALPYYSFKDSKKLYEESFVLNKVSIGDSVVKRKNSSKIEIYKKDTMIVVDYHDAYLYNDTLIRKRARYEK